MAENVFQLLYISSTHDEIPNEEMRRLLKNARENNKKLNITGFLLYDKGNVIQLLEGNRDSVEELYLKIVRDSRHSGAVRLISEMAPKRDFPDWSMGFAQVDPIEIEDQRNNLNDLLGMISENENEFEKLSLKVKVFIKSFRRSAGVDKDLVK